MSLDQFYVYPVFDKKGQNMNERYLCSLTAWPIYVIAISSMTMGLAWIFAPQPWLLDKWANEILLGSSYNTLLALPGNEELVPYLKGLYSFFGLWIFAFGLMVFLYVKITGLKTKRTSTPLYGTLAIILVVTYMLQLTYIPSSHFLWVSHGFFVAIIVSLLASRRLRTG